MELYRKIKFKFIKRKIKLQRKLNPPHIPTEKEEKVIFIIRTLIRDETSIMLIAPISGKKYIKNEKRGIFVILDDVNVTISSNVNMYYYNIQINEEIYRIISRNYNNVLESRRNKMEIETVFGVEKNLDFIAKHINDYKL